MGISDLVVEQKGQLHLLNLNLTMITLDIKRERERKIGKCLKTKPMCAISVTLK